MPSPTIEDTSVYLRLVSKTQQSTILGNTVVVAEPGQELLIGPGKTGYFIRRSPGYGTVVIDGNTGNWSYQPNLGYTGADSFVVAIEASVERPLQPSGDNQFVDANEDPVDPLQPPRQVETLTTTVSIDVIQDPSAASTAGDPYVWPIKSNVPVKLPDATAVYRMFEQGNTYINALVDCATAEHKQRMLQFVNKVASGMNIIPIIDGFFYHHLFIHSDGHEMMVDLCKKQDTYATLEAREYFKTKIETDIFKTSEFNAPCNKFTISWKTSEGIRQSTSVLFFANPHIENGITMRTSTLENATGLMIDNYKPKFMKVPSITTTKYDKLWKRLNRTKKQHHFVDIKPKTERWVYGMKNGKLLVK